ncbi:DUF3426 domain-containing protein [Marinomonas mediterranea]|jgi:Protein of unknown function (DUF3426).|uniref:MJ0042 family finger-like protein n=1 Tax=Marinomonas mediterranea (strain ATCC 700492 / JCM 21426 / NBRC 103028 / MMB-1) TaxID=717774 RepID=F2K2C9_MARM1|nr:DUF3426 domain-containing protein [Marinomonas mediterranea]ADZ92309.1 MJ0042 family finger-like protein [Marinomonas mediterranea MMB-1]WCN18360.1 DUF3426 domain-containing protein [Marinomonas mediterranea MMB-1]
MAGNFITRCPKCSTAFRVTDDVLKMAAGKVRCGQCFHIFEAQAATPSAPPSLSKAPSNDDSTSKTANNNQNSPELADSGQQKQPAQKDNSHANSPPLFTAADEEIVNPNWLNTLFKEDDLELVSEPPKDDFKIAPLESEQFNTGISQQARPQGNTRTNSNDEPAPWELELAEIEANLSSPSTTKRISGSDTSQSTLEPSPEPLARSKNAQLNRNVSSQPDRASNEASENDEPDYMQALHSLAQNVSDQTPKLSNGQLELQESMSSIAATNSLAQLVEEEPTTTQIKSKRTLLWFLGVVIGIVILASQVLTHFFDQGSRSEQFRGLYRTACTYIGCALPAFENVTAISIQHVRIQSHPQKPNALLVNAIMTNTSAYAQPMPKIALEFYDLNGSPVAARLFAPESYLHRDFLDITYMPPNTPIHLVIPIVDPGASAVTHELKVYSSDTRSY